jgi:hypothetical protein
MKPILSRRKRVLLDRPGSQILAIDAYRTFIQQIDTADQIKQGALPTPALPRIATNSPG